MLEKIIKELKKTKIFKKFFIIKTLKKIQNNKKIKRNKVNLKIKINPFYNINKYNLLFGTLFVLTFVSLITLSFLKINTIQIIKTDDISDIGISYKAIDKYRGDFLFLVNKEDIKSSLINYQSNLKEINITRIIPSTLKIVISSYEKIFKTQLKGKNYLITSNGVLIPTNKENKDMVLLELYNNKDFNFPEYKKLLNQDFLNKIEIIKNKINDNLLKINIEKIKYYVTQREAHFVISNGTILIFDINGEPDSQIEKLLVFDKESYDLIKPGIIYIDLRIKNKIFYCNITEEYQCNKNLERIYNEK